MIAQNRSAEDGVLCRGVGCPHKNPPFLNPVKVSPDYLELLSYRSAEDGVLCRGVGCPHKNPPFLNPVKVSPDYLELLSYRNSQHLTKERMLSIIIIADIVFVPLVLQSLLFDSLH